MKKGKSSDIIQIIFGVILFVFCLLAYYFYLNKFSGDSGLLSIFSNENQYKLSSGIIIFIMILSFLSIYFVITESKQIKKEINFDENTQSLKFKEHSLKELQIPDNNLTIHDIAFEYIPSHLETLKFFIGTFFIMGLLGSFIGIGETVAGAVSQLNTNSSTLDSNVLKKIIAPLSKLEIVFGVSICGLLTALTIENFQQLIFRNIFYLEWSVDDSVKTESLELLKDKKSLSSELHELKETLIESKKEQEKLLKDLFIVSVEDKEIKPAFFLRDLLNESKKQTSAFKSFNTDLSEGLNISDQTITAFKEFQTQMFKDYFVFKMEENQEVLPSEFFKNLHNNSNQQTKALKSFSTDLADSLKISTETIVGFLGEQFVDILNKPFKNHLTPALDKIEVAVQQLKQTKEESSGSIIERVIGELQSSLKDMGTQFQQSLSGSTTSQLEGLISILSQSGQAFEALPQQINSMMTVLEDQVNNTKSILDSSLEAAKQSSQVQAEQTQKLFEDMVSQLRDGVGNQQKVVEFITNKMGENAQIATKVMSEQVQNTAKQFGDTILSLQDNMKSVIETQSEKAKFVNELIDNSKDIFEKGNILNSQINNSIQGIDKALSQIAEVSDIMIENTKIFEISGANLKDTSLQLKTQSSEFINSNQKTILALENALKQAQAVAIDYANRFKIIQDGLGTIFSQIQNGLSNYQAVTSKSLNQYLGQFSEQLERATSALSGSVTSLSEVVDEVIDLSEKIGNRR